MKKSPLIPEGGVFAIPIGEGRCVYAQVWTAARDGAICHCGVSKMAGERGVHPPEVDWADAGNYQGDVNLILDNEWLRTGWPIIAGFKPARSPLRDELPLVLKIGYDWFGWRPEINSFVHYEGVQEIAKRQSDGRVG